MDLDEFAEEIKALIFELQKRDKIQAELETLRDVLKEVFVEKLKEKVVNWLKKRYAYVHNRTTPYVFCFEAGGVEVRVEIPRSINNVAICVSSVENRTSASTSYVDRIASEAETYIMALEKIDKIAEKVKETVKEIRKENAEIEKRMKKLKERSLPWLIAEKFKGNNVENQNS